MLFATSRQKIRIVLQSAGETVYDQWQEVSPEKVFTADVEKCIDHLIIYKEQYGKERPVLTWQPEPDEIRPIPDAAEAALLPQQIKTNDQLLLTGQHIEQYRHATYVATDYYEEALRRDPDDVRCLNAMGLWYIRKGRFAKAEPFLRRAVRLIMKRNPQPYEGEPLYNLALCLKYQGQQDEAYEWFWKVTWNKAWADAGYFEAAKISTAQGRLDDALDEVNRGLVYGAHNQKALALKIAVLRLMGRKQEALKLVADTLATDLFNYVARYEQYLLTGDESVKQALVALMHGMPNNYDQVALEYQAAGLCDEARQVWALAIEEGAATPMTYYYMGRYKEAEKADSSYCFPNSLEAILALESAIAHEGQSAMAHYYLGCLYYDKRQYDVAVPHWEAFSQLKPAFPTAWRNLALAYYNKQHDAEKAVACMEKAFALDEQDARIFMELDQLYKRLGRSCAERLERFSRYSSLISQRDDLTLEHITLLNQNQRYEEAIRIIDSHIFHPWEGGEGKIPAQYQLARTELSKQALSKMESKQAVEDAVQLLEECLVYPHHLGEGKLEGAQDNDFYYFLGVAHEALGQHDKAVACWEKATLGPQEPAAAMYYNDAKPDKIFYQGLALQKLGRTHEANGRFYRLLNYGKQHLFDHVVMDYFAVSLPDLQIWEGDLNLQNQIHCKYMLSLGYLGLGRRDEALRYLNEVEGMDVNHQGIIQLRTFIQLGLV